MLWGRLYAVGLQGLQKRRHVMEIFAWIKQQWEHIHLRLENTMCFRFIDHKLNSNIAFFVSSRWANGDITLQLMAFECVGVRNKSFRNSIDTLDTLKIECMQLLMNQLAAILFVLFDIDKQPNSQYKYRVLPHGDIAI